jgi:hypothetical protein
MKCSNILLACLPLAAMLSGCGSDDQEVLPREPIGEGTVETAGVIVERTGLREYVLESFQLGQRVVLRPRLFQGAFLEAGDWVRVKGNWKSPAGGMAVIFDAEVTVLPRQPG